MSRANDLCPKFAISVVDIDKVTVPSTPMTIVGVTGLEIEQF